MKRSLHLFPDVWGVLALAALWLLFFWRLFTPVEADQASLKKGDFSGQFVAFAAYQYERLTAGKVPLWNPYNNGGLPFLADTQAAVFYPPRLVTIALSKLAGGWTYHALELEMTAHVLFFTLTLYALLRRLTLRQTGSVVAGLVAALVGGYGGFLTGYPPLQLALLEAAVWLPLALLGIVEACRGEQPRYTWLGVSGLALGLSWLAGHPQTSWFLTYLLVGFLAYQTALKRWPWTFFAGGTAVLGALAFGLAAVQLLPGLEYLAHTARVGFNYESKANGFPFRDLLQLVIPGVLSLFSPLYIGLSGLVLGVIAVWRRIPGSLFWGAVALIALGLSFGGNSALFPALYLVLPGLRFFRGQERAAYLFASSSAILAGLGAAHLLAWDRLQWHLPSRLIQRGLQILLAAGGVSAAVVFALWLNDPDRYSSALDAIVLSAVIAGLALMLVGAIMRAPHDWRWRALLVALIAFELFTVNMDAPAVYDPIPPSRQLIMPPEAPPLLAAPLSDMDRPFRVDGYRGLHDNFGSLYRLMDMRGISPLFLDGPYALIGSELINPLAWELFAVRYVYTDWQQMPVPSAVIASGEDRYGPVNLHRLTDPRPFAHLVYDYAIAESDALARARLADPSFNPRHTIILDRDPGIPAQAAPSTGSAQVIEFHPESFTIRVDTPAPAIVSLAHPDYPGWAASVDDQPTPILRAYGGLSAVVVPGGSHTLRLAYEPLSARLGAAISLFTWGALALLGAYTLVSRLNQPVSGAA